MKTFCHLALQTEPQLCRFMAGGGISFKSLDELADYLGLEIVVRGKGLDR